MPASSVELARHRARFALDRETQLLTPQDTKTLTECILIPSVLQNWEQWRVFVGRSAIRTQGLVDHQIQPYNYWMAYEMTRLQRTMKSWTIAQGCRVHVFRVVQEQILSPAQLAADENEEQYVNLSPHDARLSNSAYEGMLVVDVHQKTYCHPNGFLPNQQGGQTGGGKASGAIRFQLPHGWQNWKLESEYTHMRKPWHHFGIMHMSMADKRANGLLRPENFGYEDPHDQGGWFSCQNSAVFHPAHETLRHNTMFLFPTGASNFVAANDGSETPDNVNHLSNGKRKPRWGRKYI